ncbi:hypothetical protein GQ42DRAFT_161280 [Ramicandelaber brevisporus]|nr:hypothetical protein GQ42DRAFT_161280 [Ramicandelaber brevisporus]
MASVASIISQKPDVILNPRGIPRAEFITDLEEYFTKTKDTPSSLLEKYVETNSKYKYMEKVRTDRKHDLLSKIPELESTKSIIEMLLDQSGREVPGKDNEKENDDEDDDEDELESDIDDEDNGDDDGKKKKKGKALVMHAEVSHSVYAKVRVEPLDSVMLWLGANIMLEYPIEEAYAFVSNQLSTAQKSLKDAKEDISFLQEQITTMDVNTARVYNYDIKTRRIERENTGSTTSTKA